MPYPAPRETLHGCMWLPRILEKARLAKADTLHPDYLRAYCHPSGVDGQFLAFFSVTQEDLAAICDKDAAAIREWFLGLPGVSGPRIEEWNALALNLGREGFPMDKRLGVALATFYKNVAHLNPQTVFETLEADENIQVAD